MSIAEKEKSSKRPKAEPQTDTQIHSTPNNAPRTFPTMRPNAISTEVDIEQIEPWDRNPRKHFSEEGLQELADSIRQLGLLEPIMLRMIPPVAGLEDLPTPYTPSTCRYHIIGGERRWRAAKMAGLDIVPARVFEVGESVALEMALVENLQRQDLDPIEEAEGYRALQELGYTQTQIAQRVNRSQPAVANAMRLLKLPADVLERIRKRELTPSHGIALLALPESAPQVVSAIAARAVEKKFPVSALEAFDNNTAEMLQAKGVAAQIDGWKSKTQFDHKEVCPKCPFNAYRKDSYSIHWCLRPDHYKELQAEAIKARELEATATGTGKKGKIRKLSDMKYGEYEHFYGQPVTGCTKECPCRGQAIDYDGKVVPICTDPKRYKSLKTAETREKNKAKREGYRVKVEDVQTRLDSLRTMDQALPELALITRAFLNPISDKFKPGELKAKNLADQLSALDLVKLSVKAYVEWEADRACVADYYGTPNLDVLTKLKPVVPSACSASCPKCGLAPAECMCAEIQKREQIAVAAQDLTCPLCGADDYGICKCDPDAVNAALVKDGRAA